MYNAVRMGYSGTGLKGTTQDHMVKAERDQIQKLYQDLQKTTDFPKWSWEPVITDLRQLKKAHPDEFNSIQTNLSKRLKSALARGNPIDREELEYFLELMKTTKDIKD